MLFLCLLVAGSELENLIKNPTLSGLLGESAPHLSALDGAALCSVCAGGAVYNASRRTEVCCSLSQGVSSR